ncbi:MAG: exodeoxyribonuclease VII large subunit [Spirochaetia bacterium]|nr:exodeoxyribonuclease VII large subunit [Spirochaetia bacterium]
MDTALTDYAADVSAPTPSAAAEIVSKSREELSDRVRRLKDEMSTRIQNRVENAGLLIRQFTPENLEERFRQVLQPYQLRLDDAKEEAVRNLQDMLTSTRHRVAMLRSSIEGNSPLAILRKGYAVVTNRRSGVLIGSVQQSNSGDPIDIRLHDGRLGATVENRYPRIEEETP